MAANKPVRFGDWKPNDVSYSSFNQFKMLKCSQVEYVNNLQLLSAKPVVYLVNMSEGDYIKKKNKWLAKIKQWVDEKTKEAPEVIIPICVSLEAKVY